MEIASFLKLLSKNDGFGCGFFVFGRFSQILNFFFLCCFLIVGLKFLHFKVPSSLFCTNNNDGFVSKSYLFAGFDKKKKPLVLHCDHLLLREGVDLIKNRDSIEALLETELDEEEESPSLRDDEDKVFDVITLRKMVKRERKLGEIMKTEVEKERRASEEAAEEAMAMILKLRMEKNAVEMEAKQYKRIYEQKQIYDQQVIQALQWMLTKLDDEEEVEVEEEKIQD
ncbi:unnamed protein product [Cochlearia groenlandica]